MKIIGVYGASGAGKSTAAKFIKENLNNSLLINGDIYMKEQMQKLDKEIFKALKIKKEEGVFSSNYFFQSYENQTTMVNVIKDSVTSMIKKEIETNNNKEFIIIDWLFLPMCDLYQECDITICIKADYEIRVSRLQSRLKKEQIHNLGTDLIKRYQPGTIENRAKYTALDEYGFTSQINIENNQSEEDLKNNVYSLIKIIKE